MQGFAESVAERFQRITQSWLGGAGQTSPNTDRRRAHLLGDEALLAEPDHVQPSVSLKAGRRGPKTVHKFLDNHDNIPSDPINVSDDEPEQSSSITGMSNLKSTYFRPDQSSRKTGVVRQNNAKTLDSRDEGTLLGGFSKRDPDDIIIQEPMVMKRPFMSGGLKPVNTLSPNSGSKSEYFHSQRPDAHFARSKKGPKQRMGSRENNHHYPQKKARTGPSPVSGTLTQNPVKMDTIQQSTQSQDWSSDDPRTATELARQSDTRRSRLSHTLGKSDYESGLKYNAEGNASQNLTHVPTSLSDDLTSEQKHKRSSARNPGFTSPYDSAKNDIDILHEATYQRKTELDSYLPSSPHGRSQSPKTFTAQSPYFDSLTISAPNKSTIKQHRTPDQIDIRKKSYVQAESPDEIQISDKSPSPMPSQGPKPLSTDARQTHAVSIVGDVDSTMISQQNVYVGPKRTASATCYELRAVRRSGLFDLDHLKFVIDKMNKTFAFDTGNEGFEEVVTTPQPLSKIIGIKFGHDSNKLIVYCSRLQGHPDKFGLELESDKIATDLMRDLTMLGGNINCLAKDRDWVDRAFEKCDNGASKEPRNEIEDHNKAKGRKVQPETQGISAGQLNSAQRRKRHIDQLDAPEPHIRNTEITPPQPSARDSNLLGSTLSEAESHNSEENFVDGRQFFAEPGDILKPRATRSRANRPLDQEPIQNTELNLPAKFSETGQLGDPWIHPLVFPPTGKKRETIQFEDLWRLDEDEFLNDSLVGFFLRYLEHKIEKDNVNLYKKMYFFNSYFYDSLTKGVKGKRGINFEGVAKWTRNVNLFSRDFVIVPVNENLHWYVAIICNLPHFLRRGEESEEVDSDSPDNGPEQPADSSDLVLKSHKPQQSTSAQTAEDTQRSLADLSLDDIESSTGRTGKEDDTAEAQVMTSGGRKGRRKQSRRPLPKYETDKPVIITLDSLGNARSMTCSALRQYVALEAKDKRNLEIDPSSLRGMTAKGIPNQGNFSDCGLYLCMYLEQFVEDPYAFVARLLQRQEMSQRWPKKILSAELRARLREMILSLHREQEGERVDSPIPDIGKILIDKREFSLENKFDSPSGPKKVDQETIDQARERWEARYGEEYRQKEKRHVLSPHETAQEATESSQTEIPVSPESHKRHIQAAVDAVNEPIIIEDEASSQTRDTRSKSARPHNQDRSPSITPATAVVTAPGPKGTEFSSPSARRMSSRLQHENPGQLARYLKNTRSRSPERREDGSRYRQRHAGPRHRNDPSDSPTGQTISKNDPKTEEHQQAQSVNSEIDGEQIPDSQPNDPEGHQGADANHQPKQRIVLSEIVTQVEPPSAKITPSALNDEIEIITSSKRKNKRSAAGGSSTQAKGSTTGYPRRNDHKYQSDGFTYIGT